MTANSSQEKRRYQRIQTHLDAQVRLQGDAVIPCEIRDYCLNGLYLSFKRSTDISPLVATLMATSVVVGFAARKGQELQRFKILGRVARVTSGGLGIYVESMPEGAFQAFTEASANQAALTPTLPQT